jgi:hypothetical protein
MERGTVEWNSGMVDDPVPFWANWACTSASWSTTFNIAVCKLKVASFVIGELAISIDIYTR